MKMLDSLWYGDYSPIYYVLPNGKMKRANCSRLWRFQWRVRDYVAVSLMLLKYRK